MSESPDELREQIEHTRDELADTVQALTAKADVTGRAKVKFAETTDQAKAKASELSSQAKVYGSQAKHAAVQESQVAREQITRAQAEKPWLFPSAGAFAALSLTVWFLVRRRRS